MTNWILFKKNQIRLILTRSSHWQLLSVLYCKTISWNNTLVICDLERLAELRNTITGARFLKGWHKRLYHKNTGNLQFLCCEALMAVGARRFWMLLPNRLTNLVTVETVPAIFLKHTTRAPANRERKEVGVNSGMGVFSSVGPFKIVQLH